MGPPPVAEQMKKFEPMLGNWEGTVRMEAGAEAQPWTSKSTCKKILGGHVMCFDVVGDPMEGAPQYRGLAFMGWDSAEKCLVNLGLNNFGEFHTARMYPQEGRRVLMLSMGVHMGSPMVSAGVMEWPEDGSTMKFWSDSMMMGQPAKRTFEGAFTRIQADGAAKPK